MAEMERPTTPTQYDAIIVGGGPAGSVCARWLVKAGLRLVVLDRQRFPRVKLCGGWVSPPVWEVLELSPREYPARLWPWERCHVQHGGMLHSVAGQGSFIRRYEFDEFLLRRSGAEVVQHSVRRIEQREGQWLLDDRFRAPLLVGAGGTHCPVARQLFPAKPGAPVAAQEHEFVAGAEQVAATRVGLDGEPELLLHDDLGGYSWNVPKGEWLNVGTGTSEPREVLAAWAAARAFFVSSGHVPEDASASLEQAKGHAYYLFDPAHLIRCERQGAVLVGDALGVAHPLTAEGILPALVSGRLAGEALAAGAPQRYPAALTRHPVMRDYALARELLTVGIALRDRFSGASLPVPRVKRLSRLSQRATAKGFAWLFSGRPIPHASLWRLLLRVGRPSTEVGT